MDGYHLDFYPPFDRPNHYFTGHILQSCPPINVYNEKNLERALDLAARSYLEQEVEADSETNQV